MPGGGISAEATVSIRRRADLAEISATWQSASADWLGSAAPWRTFRWRDGQKNYSGTYWSATESDHVIYESRLELTRLLYADYDPSVQHIVAQPFLMRNKVDGRIRRHVPDFLLGTTDGLVVVDVKPLAKLGDPKVAFTLNWTRKLVERRGWRYEVWTEPPPPELANIRFLAGYRHSRCHDASLLTTIREHAVPDMTLGSILTLQDSRPAAVTRASIFHLLWEQYLTVELDRPLSKSSAVRRGPKW